MTQPPPGRKLIRTPIHRIPIGEAIRTADGRLSLRIKKPNGKEVEEMPVEAYVAWVIKGAQDTEKQMPPIL